MQQLLPAFSAYPDFCSVVGVEDGGAVANDVWDARQDRGEVVGFGVHEVDDFGPGHRDVGPRTGRRVDRGDGEALEEVERGLAFEEGDLRSVGG